MAKRLFDIFWSMMGLTLLAPLLALAALLVKLEDGGPVCFRQVRIGRRGQPFRMWKFRTMVVDAEAKGPSITVGRDVRITRIGRILRKSKLDEIPQLLNVLVGEMSLVGPRPEVKRYVDLYSETQMAILHLRPGITDLASIKYRNESEWLAQSSDPDAMYVNTIMPDKLRINAAYAAGANLFTDFLVILATLGLFPVERVRGWAD